MATLADQALQWLQRRERQKQEIAEGRRLPSQAQQEEPIEEEEWELEEEEEIQTPARGRAPARTNGGVTKPVAKTRAAEPPAGLVGVSAPKGYAAAVSLMRTMPQRKRAPPVMHAIPTSVRSVNRAPPVRAAPPVPVRAAAPPAPVAVGAQFPRDKPVVIEFPDGVERPELLDGLSDTAIAFSFDGKKKKLCQEADEVLADLLGGSEAEVGVKCSEGDHQDQDSWDKYPDVGMAINEVSNTKECFCVVASPQHGLWGVGVADKGGIRYYAARIALAIGLVAQAVEEGDDVDLSGVPQFQEAYNAHNVAKRART